MKRIKRVFVANRGEIARADRHRLPGARASRPWSAPPRSTWPGWPRGWPTGRCASARRRPPRATCATTWSCRPRSAPAATRSIPATASCRRAPSSRRAARENGLTFVGPPAEVIELSGDKLRAREEAARAGVPVLPGQEVGSAADARGSPSEIGYPLLVKAAGGGGGRGIKLARDGDELEGLLSLARSEAGAAFGDERAVSRAVHRRRPPRRGADRRRRAGRGGSPRRARLLGPAPLPEADRGGARAGARARRPRRASATPRCALPARSATATWARSSSSSTPRPASTTSSRSTAGSRSSTRSPRRSPAVTSSPLQLRDRQSVAARLHPGRSRARRPRRGVPAERRGRGARLHAHPGHAVAVRGPRAARAAGRHALLSGGGHPALLRLADGQADRARAPTATPRSTC